MNNIKTGKNKHKNTITITNRDRIQDGQQEQQDEEEEEEEHQHHHQPNKRIKLSSSNPITITRPFQHPLSDHHSISNPPSSIYPLSDPTHPPEQQPNTSHQSNLDLKTSNATLDPDDELDELSPSNQNNRLLKPAIYEERQNVIRFVVVTNDGAPDSSILLTGLKNLFQRQLPNMPREHIARLVFSRDHSSLAIVKRGLDVVGGITYRPFESRGFAEIVFCAIRASEQVKGYGSHLMNHLKDHVKQSTTCMHFLTYADNYAIGYFKKQGFSKDVVLDKSVWMGYIKDYEGATIMHCAMLPRIKYLEVPIILEKQKQAILSKIKLISQSHVVHKGLEVFKGPLTEPVNPTDVPGLKEIGWNPELDQLTRKPQRLACHNIIHHLLTSLQGHPSAWPFMKPINGEEVTDYYEVIKEPMDLETIEIKLDNNIYQSLSEFLDDCKLIFENCRTYNPDGSNYVKNANRLERFLKDKVKQFNEIEY